MSKILHRGLEAKLAALNDPEWESSDDDEEMPAAATATTNNNTETKKDDETTDVTKIKPIIQSKKTMESEKRKEASRVIYLGHVPPAFEETQILQFLSQFGTITNLKLSRSKRTGNSRGYGFVEFLEKDVAHIVANTMSGYFLLGERRLVCHVVPQDKIHPNLFLSSKRNLLANKQNEGVDTTSRIQHWQSKNKKEVNGTKSVDGLKKITQRLLKRESAKRKKLKSLGIDYDFPGYEASVNDKKKKEEEEALKRKEVEKKKVKKTPSKKTKAKKAVTEVKKAKKTRSKRRLSQS